MAWIYENAHDVIILDRMFPSIDGMTILEKMRQSGYNQPVILLTALGEISDRVLGLNLGADDYIVKPFAFEELLARIYSIMRRPRKWNSTGTFTTADLILDAQNGTLNCGDNSCSLSQKECRLFELFIQNPGQIHWRR